MGDTRRQKLLVIPAILATLAAGFAAPASASFATVAPVPLTAAPTAAPSLAASVETPTPSNGARLSWSRTPTGPRPYFGARYYGSKIGRFTTVDPALDLKASLAEPQRWNRYAYGLNNPLTNIDPDGRLTIIVHGTWANGAEFARQGSEFNAAVSRTFGEQAVAFDWSGGNSVQARAEAARELMAFIDSHNFADGEPLNIVTHSHGGNVAKAYTQLPDARAIDTLVNLGTPQRPDYSINRAAVGRYVNVYDPNDGVQANGGRFGRMSGRTDAIATNIGVPSGKAGVAAHSGLHEPGAWSVVDKALPTVSPVERGPFDR